MRHDGTWATYQGIPCLSVRFRRTRGTSADRSQVTIPVPAGFVWRAPTRAELLEPIEAEPEPPEAAEVLSPTFGGATASAIELPATLDWIGDLVLGEDAAQLLVVPGLVVTGIERDSVDTPTDTPVDVLRLTLVDQRVFWARGAVTRWSYNVLRPDGTLRKDTLRSTTRAQPGQAGAADEQGRLSLGEIAADVVKALPFSPELADAPEDWFRDYREVKFPRRELAARAASTLATLGEAVEPCLDLDGRVSFHRPGAGRVGWAEGGRGANANEIPGAEVTGNGFSREALFPEQWLVVTGLERVATVALDDAEPVLWINDAPVLLSEEIVRELTDGRYGLDWLAKVVNLPGIDHGAEGVSPDVVDLLAKQAWRYFRVRGVEAIEGGKYTGKPGPNAHLLPLLARAETAGAARVPVTVEAYRWETRHERAASAQTDKLSAANRALAAIRERARTLDVATGGLGAAPLDDGNPTVARDGINIAGLSAAQILGRLSPADVDIEQLDRHLRALRRAELLREQGQDALAQEFLDAYGEKVAAVNETNPGASEHFALARELSKLERENAEGLGTLTQGLGADQGAASAAAAIRRPPYGPQIDRAVAEAAGKIAAAKQSAAASQAATAAGFDPRKSNEIVYLANLPRKRDAGARVVSAEAGVVQTSGLAGWVADQAVGHPAQTNFVPRAVRVIFGAKLAPRIDLQPGQLLDRIATGGAVEAATTGGGQDYIPANVLTEAASYYESAWLRTAQGRVEPARIEDVPMNQATVVRNRWRELIPMPPGVSNRPELDGDARKLALQLSKRPDRLASASIEAAGPWSVNCDGLVSGVSIVMEQQGGVPCGFTTFVDVGGEGTVEVGTGTRERRA